MKKSKLKVTTEEAFALGKLEGAKESFKEILDMVNQGPTAMRVYATARLKSLNSELSNPFKRSK